ncbi:MAG: PQQ-binding-like beta-propeller repeat protein [Pirellulales bacterium]|nr:PQQ-binding-like beta-propeller repeat protein [Pirellulales bacterium]
MPRKADFILPPILVLLVSFVAVASAGDWPQWRFDAGRGAATPEELPAELHLQWVRRLPSPRPAWPESQPWLRFDVSYSPVAAAGRLFVPSMVNDSLTAYDADSGEELWRFVTDGPVRLAPVADKGRVYFASDDGCLYCVTADKGELVWRFRGGPSDRKVLGNERLISTWPIRGGPVFFDGTIYFTAGIWPFMGIFVHAVDAETGKAVWTNSGESCPYLIQPHNSPAFAGFVPCGPIAATESCLVVPGGRTPPACYDLKTGRQLHWEWMKKGGGSYQVTAHRDWYFAGGFLWRMSDGKPLTPATVMVHDGTAAYSLVAEVLAAEALAIEEKQVEQPDRKGRTETTKQYTLKPLWNLPVPQSCGWLYLKAGPRFYAGKAGQVAALEAKPGSEAAEVVWRGPIEGSPWTMLAADGRLFVVTVEGRIYAFGGNEGKTVVYDPPEAVAAGQPQVSEPEATAKRILGEFGASEGYAVLLGLESGELAEQLARGSKLQVIAVDPDEKKVAAFRRRMIDAGLYGTHAVAHVGDPAEYPFPPYLASLVVCAREWHAAPRGENHLAKQGAVLAATLARVLRPYGGTAWFSVGRENLTELANADPLSGFQWKSSGDDATMLVRSGPLPGAADWTHQYGDAANTGVSSDERVKAPLGLLWFGGPSNDEVLPRHGHGPAPQVAAGRLFIEGPDMLRALDIYTGRLLWQKGLPALGKFYDNTDHQPGANEIGSNYVSLADSVYVAYGSSILRLDAATGRTLREFPLKPTPDCPEPRWGYLGIWEDVLLATATPVTIRNDVPAATGDKSPVKPNDVWRYLGGSHPAENWTAVDFDDKAWKAGEAGFGYGDKDDRTKLPDMKGSYTAVYLRKSFEGNALEQVNALSLAVNYDDAFIAYLNGQEVARAANIAGHGREARVVGSHEAKNVETFPIGRFRELLRPGTNVLAVEGHNVNSTSSDFTVAPYLIAKNGSGDGPASKPAIRDLLSSADHASTSRTLSAADRHTGQRLWHRDATYGFRHNNIAAGGGKVFVIDSLSADKQRQLQRRGVDLGEFPPRLAALDLRTGRELWSTTEDVFGTFLNYSAEHDVLLQAGSAARDRAADEAGTGMVAYRGSDGSVLWKALDRRHGGPCLLHGDTIITQGEAYSLLTGEPRLREHPLTGEPLPWTFKRNYGCNTAIASCHLLTFRSAAAGFFDLARDGGTGNLGGFKSSCTSNLVVASGLLNAPEYTRTCTCNYQNQTSLAMIHDPDVEMWTFNDLAWDGKPVRRIGINFGAPGDRRAEDGTLWLDWPSMGGPSPDLPLKTTPEKPETFRHHSSLVTVRPETGGLAWVAASGVRGVRHIRLTLAKEPAQPRTYTVRLGFLEPDSIEPGQRVFDLRLQGQEVLSGLDIAKEAGRMTTLVKQFRGIKVTEELDLELNPSDGAAVAEPVLSGIEVVAE